MAANNELQNQWEAFLNLAKVREPKLFEHFKMAYLKEVSKYNLLLLTQTPEDLKEVEIGLRVYYDKIGELTTVVWGSAKGIKVDLASEEEWGALGISPKGEKPAESSSVSLEQSEILKVLESTIRQKVEQEIRASLQKEINNDSIKFEIQTKLKENLEEEEKNRRLAVRMALITEGDKALTEMVMSWQQAKQLGEGGITWSEVKQHLLELLDTTVQLIHS
jgi:hypothetical protein